MKIRNLLAAAALVLGVSAPAFAATYNLGSANAGVSTSQTLVGTQVFDTFTFSIDTVSPGFAVTEISIDTIGSSFDTEIGLFDSANNFIASNRNGVGISPASKLTLSNALGLVTGSYTLVLGAWNINFGPTLADTDANGFPSGNYNVNISSTVSPVPVPAAGLMLLTGLLGFAGLRRRQRLSKVE